MEILSSDNDIAEFIFSSEKFIGENPHLQELNNDNLIITDEKSLKQMSTQKTPQDIIIVAEQKDYDIDPKSLTGCWSFFLDEIQDPGNLGTIFRIADWFGIEHVILSEGCVDPYNPKVVQSAMGALLRIKFQELPKAEFISASQSNIYASAMEGISVFDQNLDPGVIVIGNESKGVSAEMVEAADQRIHIPGKGGAESLNAAVAAGILAGVLTKS